MSFGCALKIAIAVVLSLPAIALSLTHKNLASEISVLVFGTAMICAAFLLAWASETAQKDVSASLSIALLAFIAVLPEYAVDLYFAYSSGHRPNYAQYAAANMTGSNRLLVGFGWPMISLLFWLSTKKRGRAVSEIVLEPRRAIELGALWISGIYAFIIPITRRISLFDSVVLLAIFAIYALQVSRQPKTEPELVGVSQKLAELPTKARRFSFMGMFVFSAGSILLSAEPFAEALVSSGKELGIDEFLLVQWLAPLASEAPELLVAALLAWRLKSDGAIGTLLSSKVNQWTLLIGSIPIARAIGGGGAWLPLDARQVEELLLTAAQTMMGLAVLLNRRFNVKEAAGLLLLFFLQFVFPQREARFVLAALYLILAIASIVRNRVRTKTRKQFSIHSLAALFFPSYVKSEKS